MWNSYRFHYPSGRKSELEKIIKIDTLNTDRYFYIKKNFDRALVNELIPVKELLNATPRDWPGPSDSEVIKEFYKLLNGRPLYSLTRREATGLIYSLFIRTGANLRQISSITHENYEFVRKLCLKGREKTG